MMLTVSHVAWNEKWRYGFCICYSGPGAHRTARRRHMDPLRKVIPAILLGSLLSHAQVTANGGNDRTNANLEETQLTPATVSASGFGKLGTFPVDGQVYAQPLYVSRLAVPGAGTHNVLFVA